MNSFGYSWTSLWAELRFLFPEGSLAERKIHPHNSAVQWRIENGKCGNLSPADTGLGIIASMRFLFILLSVLAGLLTLLLVVLVVGQARGIENIVFPAFGLLVSINPIIHLLIAVDGLTIGIWALVRKRLSIVTGNER